MHVQKLFMTSSPWSLDMLVYMALVSFLKICMSDGRLLRSSNFFLSSKSFLYMRILEMQVAEVGNESILKYHENCVAGNYNRSCLHGFLLTLAVR